MKRQRAYQKAIWIEYRHPFTKEEKKLYGQTFFVDDSHARIFVNTAMCKDIKDQVMTLWHELFHTVCAMHGYKLTGDKEEDLARRFEAIVWELTR